MNVVDWVLIGALMVFALAGWRQGFVAGALSFAGFLGGGLMGAFLAPPIAESISANPAARIAIVVGSVLVLAVLGQFAATMLGRAVRSRITWQPAKVVDSLAGAGLNIIAVAVVVWIIASALAYLPATNVTEQIRQSRVLTALDRAVPDAARNAFGGLRDAVSASGVPRVFSGLAEVTGPDVEAPDAAPAEVSEQLRDAVVKVSGEAAECAETSQGSGFVFAPELVLTNAHVVAGVERPTVRAGRGRLDAQVVLFDPTLDVAVLRAPGLSSAPLTVAPGVASSGSPALLVGYPGGGPLQASSARIRALVDARGDDIYGVPGVARQVYSFRGEVRNGNSGGPLLDARGEVLGMVFASGLGDGSTGYAISADQLRSAMAEGRAARSPIGTGSCRLR